MDTTQVEYDRAQTACATLSLVLYYCMTNSQSAATKAFVARTLDEDAPMVLRLHGDSLLNIADFAANNEAHDILTLLLLNQMPNRNADGTVLHTELRRVFDRRDQAKTFRQRVVVELDEPGRIRENADLKRSGLKWNAKQQKYVREGDKPLDNVLSHIQQQGVAQYQSALAREAWYVDTDGTNEAGTSAPMNDNGRDATTSAGMIRQVELDAKMNLLRHLWDVYTARTPTAIDSQATDMALRSGASPSSSPFLASMSAVDVSLS